MEATLQFICLAALIAGILFFVWFGKQENQTEDSPGGLLSGQKKKRQTQTTQIQPRLVRPAPLPEDPAESQKLLQILNENEILFEEFGKITRVHGKLIYGIRIDKEKGSEIWETLTEVMPKIGYWPMLVASNVFKLEEDPIDYTYTKYPTPQDIIRLAEKYPLEKYLTRIEDLLADRLDQIAEGDYWGDAEVPDPDTIEPINNWDFAHQLMAFIPTPHSWQAPAYFLGDNMLGLKDEEMLMVLRHWEELYGAKVYFFIPNLMALKTSRRPETKEEALQLAYEQSIFCADLYQMHYYNPEHLAANLMKTNFWEFWWD